MQVKGSVLQVFVAQKSGTWVETLVVSEVVNLLSVGLGSENVSVDREAWVDAPCV